MADLPASSSDPAAIDLEVVANSYRFVSDDRAFKDCLFAWSKKLTQAGDQHPDRAIDSDGFVKEHVLALRNLLDKMADKEPRNSIAEAVVEIDTAAMVVTPRGIVATMNAAAHERFHAVQGQGNAFDWIDPISVPDFESVRESANEQGDRRHAIIRTFGEDDDGGLAEVYTLPANDGKQCFIVIRAIETRWSDIVDITLEKAFKLTAAERQIARALYETCDTARIATSRKTSPQTIRTQVRTILGKTDTKSQVDLIRLLGLLNARAGHGQRAEQDGWRDPWGNQRIVCRPCGRRLAYSWTGAENGKPALIVHGAVQGYILGGQTEARLKKEGIKLYALCRPGFGASESGSELDFLGEQEDAIGWLLDKLGLKGIPAIGLGNGSIPLLRIAAERPDLFGRLLVTGLLQPHGAVSLSRLTTTQRALAKFVHFAPRAAETIARIGDRYIHQKGVDWYLAQGWKDVPEVQGTLADPEITPLIRNACELIMTASTWDFIREMQSQWHVDPTIYPRISCPVHHLWGEHDRSVTAADAEAFASQAEHFSSERVADAGYFLPYEAPKLFADRLIKTVLD